MRTFKFKILKFWDLMPCY